MIRQCGAFLAAISLVWTFGGTTRAATENSHAVFSYLHYQGSDAFLQSQIAKVPGGDNFVNPVLPGFYPDPSVTRVGEDFYLVTSTFAFFPGLPVFKSKDLVNWQQIGNAIDRPGMLDFSGLGLSRGVFAPTIEYHQGTYYIANTCVDCGGNYVLTATDPAGPWSDPVFVPHVGGIDPSLFFDRDGRTYMINNDAPMGTPRYDGHRAIWIRQVDPKTFDAIDAPRVLLDGGVRPAENPIWIEGPHIYRRGGFYYLSAAEGGTAEDHRQVVLRARNIYGPYVPYDKNPILTQRDLDPARDNPVTSVGHADLVQDVKGKWWATFLGTRPYRADTYNTGREVFLLPVRWRRGWPVILERGVALPRLLPAPAGRSTSSPVAVAAEYDVRDTFANRPGPEYLQIRGPVDFYSTGPAGLTLEARADVHGGGGEPAFLGRRQQHIDMAVQTQLSLDAPAGTEAGLLALQSDEHFFSFTVGRARDGKMVARLRQRAGAGDPVEGTLLAELGLGDPGALVTLRITADANGYDFAVATGTDGRDMVTVFADADPTILSTRRAGGFVGAVIGPYASSGFSPR